MKMWVESLVLFFIGISLTLFLAGCSGLSWSSATQQSQGSVVASPTPIPVPSAAATGGPQIWHNQGLIDSGTGDYGSLFYSPSGDLYVVYSDIVASAENLNVQVRPFGGAFGGATLITTDGRTSCMYFNSPSDMWLASESSSQANIFHSTDTGVTWNPIQSYPAVTLGSSEGDFPCQFETVGGNPSLYFGETNSIQTAAFGGPWPGSASVFSSPITSLGSVLFQAPSTYLVSSSQIYQSSDGGATYSQVGSFSNVGGLFLRASDNSIFVADDFKSGAGPLNEYWEVWQSPDFGTSWTDLVIDNDVLNFGKSYVASIGSLIASLVVVNNNQIYSMISYDGGVTWNLPTLLVDVSGAGNFIRSVNVSTSTTASTIGFVYSVEDALGTRLGVYLEELF